MAAEILLPCCRDPLDCRKRWAVVGFRGYPEMRPRVLRTIELPPCHSGRKKVMRFEQSDDVMLVEYYTVVGRYGPRLAARVIWKPTWLSDEEAAKILAWCFGLETYQQA